LGWLLVAFDSICGIYGALVLYVWHLGFVSPLYASSYSAQVGASGFWCIGAQASPSHEPFSPSLEFSSEVPSAWRGGSWLEGAGLPAMGA